MGNARNGSSQGSAREYWEANPTAASANQWTANPVVANRIYQRMSGGQTTKHWLTWLTEDYLKKKTFETMLSPGCGTGDHEIMVASARLARTIDAFDFSSAAIALARDRAKDASYSINFYTDDLNTFKVPAGKTYDIVLCSGSLHHVREIERFLQTVASVLKPEGYFIVNEYVGACYNIYPKRQIDIINRLLRHIPPDLQSSDGTGQLQNGTIQQAIATDPSESVRSKLISPFLEFYFEIELRHPFGGALLHPLYPLLNHTAFTSGDERMEVILRLLLEFEDLLMEIPCGLESDFCLFVCRPKL
jgi:SAM-dependent methyltransferase